MTSGTSATLLARRARKRLHALVTEAEDAHALVALLERRLMYIEYAHDGHHTCENGVVFDYGDHCSTSLLAHGACDDPEPPAAPDDPPAGAAGTTSV